MPGLLALLPCSGPHDGPWLRFHGDEIGVQVVGVREGLGERVFAEIEEGSLTSTIGLRNGFTPLALAKATRYRIRYIGDGNDEVVSADIVTNGKH